MEKNGESKGNLRSAQKILRVMKILCFLMLVWLIQVRGEAYSQNQLLTLQLKNCNVEEFLQEVKNQTGIRFMYRSEFVRKIPRFNLDVRQKRVEDVLKQVFAGQGIHCRFEDEVVILVKEEPGKEQQAQMQEKKMIKVSGTVKDEKGESLPGATVLLKGTSLGTATDIDGRYSLTIPEGVHTLLFTMVGMESQEIPLSCVKNMELNIALKYATSEMDEVVVTGYFNKSKDSFTGSVTQAKREELRKFGNVNLLEALKRVDPSFKIKENNSMGSDPNTLPDFFVRGESSFMGNSNIPTFIVDGYEVSLQRVFDMDMERIESITILKDASATILYGSRAANGVVVIETRRPAEGKFSVSYSNRTSLSMVDLSDYDLMNAREKLEYEEKAGLYDYDKTGDMLILEKIKANIARGVNTDWLAQPVRHAVSHAHSLYLEGGTEAVVYGLGANYNKKSGVMKDSWREIFGTSFDLTYRVKNKISIRNSFEFSQTNIQNSPYGSFSLYTAANPYNPIYDEDGHLIETFTVHPERYANESQYQNPLYNASLPYKDESHILTISDNLSLDYFILPELRFKGSVSLTKTVNRSDKYVSPDNASYKQQSQLEMEDKGEYTKTNGNEFSYNVNATLSYNLQNNGHLLFSGIGLNLSQNKSVNSSYVATGFVDGRFNEIWFATKYKEGGKPSGSELKNRLAGFFANLNYSYNNRYFVDLSGRLDGSSKFGKDKRFAPFWSAGIGWNLNNETFMENAEWLSRLTVRASIGETGNQTFDSYQARTMLEYNQSQMYYQSLGATFIAYGNTDLEWQKSLKRNLGIDIEVLQRRLTMRFDYYNDLTNGLLLPVSVTPSLGFTNYTSNFGKQKNNGYEFDINAVIIRHKDFDWAVNFSGTHNRNRITRISSALSALNKENNEAWNADQTRPIAMYEEGESLNAIKAVRSLGINPANGKELFLTRTGEITETWNYKDKVVVGCTDPTLEGNIGTNIIWKNWSLNILMRYSFGGQLYNSTLAERVEGASPYSNADKRVLEERWQYPGQHCFYKDIADRTTSNYTSRFVQDNNFLEMSNISLSWRMPQAWLKKLGISAARIGLNTSDLFYVSTVKRERGIDYPFAREYTFSLNVNF